jgi:hypothetical protein
MKLEGRRARKGERRRARVVAFEIPWRSFRPRTRFEKDGPEAGVLGPALRRLDPPARRATQPLRGDRAR